MGQVDPQDYPPLVLVADLPAVAAIGQRATVTDAAAPAFLAPLVGGGAVVAPAMFNGVAWVSA
jgi:hypothetical protein